MARLCLSEYMGCRKKKQKKRILGRGFELLRQMGRGCGDKPVDREFPTLLVLWLLVANQLLDGIVVVAFDRVKFPFWDKAVVCALSTPRHAQFSSLLPMYSHVLAVALFWCPSSAALMPLMDAQPRRWLLCNGSSHLKG